MINVFKCVVILTVIFNLIRCDILLDVLKQSIDQKSSACDNLYRYTCPLGVDTTISQQLEKLVEPIKENYDTISKTIPGSYSFFDVALDIPRTESFVQVIANAFDGKCSEEIFNKYKLAFNFIDKNSCFVHENEQFSKIVSNMQHKLSIDATQSMTFIRICTMFNLTDGVVYLDNLFGKMKNIIREDIEDTKWLKKHNQVDNAIKSIQQIQLLQGIDNQNSTELFFESFENCFKSCIKDFPTKDQSSALVCSIYGYYCASSHDFAYIDTIYNMNAANEHNNVITIGLPFIIYASQSQDDVLRTALISSILAHELSHTLMNSITASNDNIFSYFPSEAEDCITKQFQSSCNQFKEVNCFMTFRQMEECGADIIGMNLAYNTFKNVTDNNSSDWILNELKLSNIDQLFFLTYWNILCKPEKIATAEIKDHPASNIRVNAVVQLPEFQKSFNCSDSSTMMRSRTEQCFVYGKYSKYK